LRPLPLTSGDLAQLKLLLDRAIVEDLELKELRKLPDYKLLRKEAVRLLDSLTQDELRAFRKFYLRAKELGAGDEPLRIYGPIH
jgi:hypothetical protein